MTKGKNQYVVKNSRNWVVKSEDVLFVKKLLGNKSFNINHGCTSCVIFQNYKDFFIGSSYSVGTVPWKRDGKYWIHPNVKIIDNFIVSNLNNFLILFEILEINPCDRCIHRLPKLAGKCEGKFKLLGKVQ